MEFPKPACRGSRASTPVGYKWIFWLCRTPKCLQKALISYWWMKEALVWLIRLKMCKLIHLLVFSWWKLGQKWVKKLLWTHNQVCSTLKYHARCHALPLRDRGEQRARWAGSLAHSSELERTRLLWQVNLAEGNSYRCWVTPLTKVHWNITNCCSFCQIWEVKVLVVSAVARLDLVWDFIYRSSHCWVK